MAWDKYLKYIDEEGGAVAESDFLQMFVTVGEQVLKAMKESKKIIIDQDQIIRRFRGE